jgi:hypothetical protein
MKYEVIIRRHDWEMEDCLLAWKQEVRKMTPEDHTSGLNSSINIPHSPVIEDAKET